MANNSSKIASLTKKKKSYEPLKVAYLILLIGYGFVTVLTPNLMTFDSNGPKFLSLALLNLATFLFLFSRKEVKNKPEWYYAFFRNGVGMAFSSLMIVSLLSFFKAINVQESVLQFSKIFTTFSATYLISILVMTDKRNIRFLCVAMTLLLIYDSITVFSEIINFIHGKVGSIGEIKTVYSNKNMLASSIFVRIPFALWLMAFTPKWSRALGIFGIFLAFLATLFLSTRAFYLGTFALTILLVLFFCIRYKQTQDKYQLKLTGIYLILVIFSFLLFSATQHYFYPKADTYTLSVGARLATITQPGGGGRLEGWKRSWHVFREDPILGVGLGNWKIATLQEENLTLEDFTYHYKAHNDFIETTTESGIFGGLLYLTLFLFSGWIFLRRLFRNDSLEGLILFFLPVFGLFCYSVDAFFNFPHDRPEMQVLFALFIGMAVAFTSLYPGENAKISQYSTMGQSSFLNLLRIRLNIPTLSNPPAKFIHSFFLKLMITFFMLMLALSVYILYLNFNSLILQRIVFEDIERGKLTHPASQFLNGFPAIPNLNSVGEPIAALKGRYLINENRNEEAIALLKKDESNPYDPRVELFIALAYHNQNNLDSSLAYSQKVYKIKPYYYKNIANLFIQLNKKGLKNESFAVLDKYLDVIKWNREAWLYAASNYDQSGNIKRAVSVIDSAARYFPGDSLVLKQKKIIHQRAMILPYQAMYDAASVFFNAKKFNEAIRIYDELLSRQPGLIEIRNFRAYSYYFIKEYAKSNADLNFLISSGTPGSNIFNLYNLRGSNYYSLGKKDEACKNFKIAADMGDKDGLENFKKICK